MGSGGGCCIGNCCIGNCCIGEAIRNFFCFSDCSVGSCCVGNAPGPSESDIHAKKVADELAEMRQKTDDEVRQKESGIMDEITQDFADFLKEIKELNQRDFGGKKLNIDIDSITKKNDGLKKKVVGCIGSAMDKRLVQTDKELSVILEERDEEERRKNFDAFVKRILNGAIKEFKKQITKTVNQQSELVKKEIVARLCEVNKTMEESIQAYTVILEQKEKGSHDLEQIQVNYMYQSSLCDLLLCEIES